LMLKRDTIVNSLMNALGFASKHGPHDRRLIRTQLA
jgi:hypothetical protein